MLEEADNNKNKHFGYFLQGASHDTWQDKYGLPSETPLDNLRRVARANAKNEPEELRDFYTERFYDLMKNKRFFGGGRIMANAGAESIRGNASLINCTTLPLVPDSIKGMHKVQGEAVELLAAGCGVGYNFSLIRPDGADIFGLGAQTSGTVSFMKTFDIWCSTIMSAGGRRGKLCASTT